MISKRRMNILASLIIIDLVVFTVAAFVGEQRSILRRILLLLQVVLWILYLCSARCPYCPRFGLSFGWKDTDAGHCKYCGRLVEFKEHQDE